MDNIRHLKASERMEYHLDNIENRQLVAELVDDADVVVHLAAAVGVKLIVESPVKTIETNVNGTQLILEAACKKRKLVLTASTSEVTEKTPTFASRGRRSSSARHQRPLELRRLQTMSFSPCGKKKASVIVVRLFNTVGRGRPGMDWFT